MTQRGEGARAVGASLVSSLVGSLVGALALTLLIPLAQPLARRVGSAEMFMLAVLGISFMAAVSESSRLKGLAAGGLGLLISTVGMDPSGAIPRFTGGHLALWDGIGAVPVSLGLFAIPEIVQMATRATVPPHAARPARAGLLEGVRDARRLWRVVADSSVIGTCLGLVPGVGAGVAQWLAYARAARRSHSEVPFGQGAIEGVIAPSAANNATLGGSLVPALAFGVPGGLMSAMLTSALIVKGLVPGPQMLAPEAEGGHLSLVFSFVWLMVIGNIAAVALSIAGMPLLDRLTRVRATRLAPFLVVLILLGTFCEREALADLAVTGVMGVLGLALVRDGWPRVPVLLGVVLGPLAETRLLVSMDAYGWSWLARPGVIVIAIVIVVGWLAPRGSRVRPGVLHRVRDESWFSAGLIVLLLAVGVAAGSYPSRAATLPRLLALVTMVFVAFDMLNRWRTPRGDDTSATVPDTRPPWPTTAWIALFIALVWLFGFPIGAPLGVGLYLWRRGEPARVSIAGALATFVVLFVGFGQLLRVHFPEGAVLTWAGIPFS